MNWLKRWLREWLAVPNAPAAPPGKSVVPAGTLKRIKWAAERSSANAKTIIAEMYPNAGPLAMPDLPPGVLPDKDPPGITFAMDGAVQEIARDAMPQGGQQFFDWGNAGVSFGYFFQGYPYLAQLAQISEYRAPSEMLATEMTRKWVKLKATKQKAGESEDRTALADKITEIEQCMEDMDVRGKFRECITQDGMFGRSQLYIRIKGQEGDEKRQLPLVISKESIAKGSLLGFQPIEPYWTTPYSYNAVDPTRPDFYKPVSWFIMGKKTHASRLLMFLSRPVPDLLKPSYNFGGISMTQLLEPAVNMWLRTRRSVNNLLHNFSITMLKTNLASLLEDTEDGGVMARAQLLVNNRDNQGVAVIDMTTEDIVKADTSLAGLDKLQAQSQEHMAAICHEPLVVMTGVTPSGLNASSEGEIAIWHEYVGAQQKNTCDANLKQVIECVQLHLYGEIDDGITHEWVPLDEPTAVELAAERKSDAEAAGTYIDKGVLDPQEVRDRIAKDPLSGYDGLTGDAPGPPLDPNADPEGDDTGDDDDAAAGEADASREHESGEADADRKHESKENDKQRAHELKLATKKKPAAA